MPKRRMTPARKAAIAKWQRAGVNARKSKANPNVKRWSASELATPRKLPKVIDDANWYGRPVVPTGKNTFLYHRTNSNAAQQIMQTKKWISGSTTRGGLRGRSWFSHGGTVEQTGYYGSAILAVSVPRKLVRKELYSGKGVTFVSVANKNLRGRQVRRIK